MTLTLLVTLIAGCGQSSDPAEDNSTAAPADESPEPSEDPDTEKLVIGYAAKSATNTSFMITNNGCEQAAKDLGVELIMLGPPKDQDVAGQLAVIEDLVNRNVDALVIAAADSSAVVSGVQKANAAGIPVIAIDTAINGGEIASYVTTDNLAAAALGAEWMAKALDGKGNVVMINGVLAQSVGSERRDGFYNYMAENFPDIKIVAEVNSEWQADKAMSGMEDALRANPDIDGVFCAWDAGTIAVIPVLEQAGILDEVALLGFDAAPDALKQMKEGKVDADIAQYLFKIGYQGVEAAVKAAKGEASCGYVLRGSLRFQAPSCRRCIPYA
ncbi:sugar ABC transporter substrate-binding protein [Youxingia wuxianensis]|uniref:Sugar ABC transporter substrate-binding protein n=1 Tax=Youxingia wuxianensis TaxID=2763678 RepID=A0A926II43_9FIRM|nr:sugar ABC transporter substrate-binding protein [Youxingia wuxianensis]MBC8585810.1 sugar ABC transporter substrate-binding protein [Youxingia wuxianensis]